MANSVTFPPEYGGDGNTYTDDGDPNTGLANGGHRTRFVPALENAVAMAAWTKAKADETAADRQQTGEDRVATAADRQQTGEDRVATGEDRQQTGEDRVATGEDRVATGEDRQQTGEDRVAASGSAAAANSSAAAASGHADAAAASALQAGDAKTRAEAARDAAMLSAGTFPSVSAALAETADGEYFTVVEGQFLRLYLNDAGAAQPQFHYPSAAALQVSEQSLRAEIQARPDPLLTSLLF
ncbi:hypothetical protein [uncultured Halomonas sp.]|uniref:hypothetical protein n=1 Tax=uncultured Halomonas sp. TaxID=173971 RepID=UPI00260EAD00|nr:hypothetical protein [uncultured Halomonas sp.]